MLWVVTFNAGSVDVIVIVAVKGNIQTLLLGIELQSGSVYWVRQHACSVYIWLSLIRNTSHLAIKNIKWW